MIFNNPEPPKKSTLKPTIDKHGNRAYFVKETGKVTHPYYADMLKKLERELCKGVKRDT